MKTFLLIALLFVSVLFVGCVWTSQQCGGIEGKLCPEGYICQYKQDPEKVADAAGRCVPKT